jgi:HK97 family phage major capsid protein
MNLLDEVRKRIKDLQDQRAALDTERDERQAERIQLVAAAEQRGAADLSDDERSKFNDAGKRLADIKGELAALEERLAAEQVTYLELQETEDARRAAAAKGPKGGGDDPNVRVGKEARVYEGQAGLYVRDLLRTTRDFGLQGSDEAMQRLNRHAQELDVEARAIGRTTDTEWGFFVPPLYEISDYADILRAGRPFADLLSPRPLPSGVDQVKIPRLTTGTKVRVQAGDKAAVTTQDIVSAETTAELVTVAGYIDVAVQAIDQSPVDTQSILFEDLQADYVTQLDTLLWSGAGPASNQPLGALTLTGTAVVTYTDATPTAAELYRKIGEAVATVNANRKLPPNVIIMTPARWYWFASSVDSSGRPLTGFDNSFPQNVPAFMSNIAPEARVGTMFGLPVIIDPNMPTNLGAGTNQDTVVVTRITDSRFWEGTPRMAARPVADAASENLLVRFVYYRYVIFLPGRYPTSWVKIDGTGLTTPAFT